MAAVALHEADSVEILTGVDNTIDMMLAGTPNLSAAAMEQVTRYCR